MMTAVLPSPMTGREFLRARLILGVSLRHVARRMNTHHVIPSAA
jgi:hypothetical protein